jgi:hypothetical protein
MFSCHLAYRVCWYLAQHSTLFCYCACVDRIATLRKDSLPVTTVTVAYNAYCPKPNIHFFGVMHCACVDHIATLWKYTLLVATVAYNTYCPKHNINFFILKHNIHFFTGSNKHFLDKREDHPNLLRCPLRSRRGKTNIFPFFFLFSDFCFQGLGFRV